LATTIHLSFRKVNKKSGKNRGDGSEKVRTDRLSPKEEKMGKCFSGLPCS
jgi:hypothetical protein